MSHSATILESGNTLSSANLELMAIAELLDVQDQAELKMSEWGRSGLAAMLHRISTKISEANCNLPSQEDLDREIAQLAMKRAIGIIGSEMARGCGNKEVDHD